MHGKGSLINKMPGDPWQRRANLRALYAYMWAHPGKKLLFMGQEFAQEAEWSHERSLDWHLLEHPEHAGIQSLVRDLNLRYRDEPALWEMDFDGDGLLVDRGQRGRGQRVRVRAPYQGLRARDRVRGQPLAGAAPRLPARASRAPGRWVEALNTDSTYYGGSDVGNLGGVVAEPIGWHSQPFSAEVTLPPLGALWLVPEEQGRRSRPART